MTRKVLLLVIGVPLALVVAVVGGTWAYINVIRDEAPARLTLTTSTTVAGVTTTAGATGTSASSTSPDGSWKVTSASTAGYRVKEVLFGQSATAVGRTSSVTGTLAVAGTKVPTATFTVDMTTVKSDSGQRDGQFHGRIMETSRFPKAVFTLTSPINLASAPTLGTPVDANATGTFELHGVKKAVTIPVKAVWNGSTIEVTGTIPVAFTDFGIDNPSGGPASVGDAGEVEFKLVLERA
jgi:polyisoprenoid-binding protein YceI